MRKCGMSDVRRECDGKLRCQKCRNEMPPWWLDQVKATQPKKDVAQLLAQLDRP